MVVKELVLPRVILDGNLIWNVKPFEVRPSIPLDLLADNSKDLSGTCKFLGPFHFPAAVCLIYSPNNLLTRLRTLSFSGSYGWSFDGISRTEGRHL